MIGIANASGLSEEVWTVLCSSIKRISVEERRKGIERKIRTANIQRVIMSSSSENPRIDFMMLAMYM